MPGDAPLILVLNPGSTSTRVAVYRGEEALFSSTRIHSPEEISGSSDIFDQVPLRRRTVIEEMEKNGVEWSDLSAIAARGAPLKPLEGGTYRINARMLEDLKAFRIQSPHVSLLAGIMAAEFGEIHNIPAFIADPISVDELDAIARLSGLPEIPRRSLWHALNCRAVARKAAKDRGKRYEHVNLIVVHLGSGITISCHRKGRTIDVTDANSDGPFSPERSGTVPLLGLAELCFSGKYDREGMIRRITREGGMKAYLGTSDAMEVEKRIATHGDKVASLIYEGMAYQIAKEIGAMAAVLAGEIEAIVLTGALAQSPMLIDWIQRRVSFLAPVLVYPGEYEMEALAMAVLRVLRGEEEEKVYM